MPRPDRIIEVIRELGADLIALHAHNIRVADRNLGVAVEGARAADAEHFRAGAIARGR